MGFSLFLLFLFGIQRDEQEREKSFLLSKAAVGIPTNKLEIETGNRKLKYAWGLRVKFHLRDYKRNLPREWLSNTSSVRLLFNYYKLLYAKLPITQFIYGSAYRKLNCKSLSHLNMVMIICSSVFSPSFARRT